MGNHLIIVLVCCLFFIGYKDDKTNSNQYDPSQPVVFTDFSLKEGDMQTHLYIEDSNFRDDPAKTHVTTGGEKTKTIGADRKRIYYTVPSKTFDGIVSVHTDDPDSKLIAEHIFKEELKYTPVTIVDALLRKVSEDNDSAFQEDSFDEGASIPSNNCVVFDPKYKDGGNRLPFSSSHFDGLRLIDLTKQTIECLFPRMGYSTMYSFTFSADGDTLLFTDDHGQDSITRANIYYSLHRENFWRIHPYNYGGTAYSLVYVDDGTIFYATW